MVLGIRALLLGISVAITQAVYPIIPRLYNLFLYFANMKFFDNDFIYRVWRNIYVLVGVIVLFAIAIKLIGAMVNPDTLTDNKKGVKGAFFRTVISIVLIFICPFLFDITYNVQSELLSDNFIIKRVFGYNLETRSIGQMLAWETFSAFCTPINQDTRQPITADEISEIPAYYKEYYYVGLDIDYISQLDFELYWTQIAKTALGTAVGGDIGGAASDAINWGFEYNSILCPLAGILVAYEMMLLCMDTVFRIIKLTFLQLMLPIVLGAYVFNPDILKKWAKEYFSTYIIVFLQVLGVGFMVLAIVAIRGGSI